MMKLKKRTELKKFVSSHVPPRKGRGHAKVTNVLFSLGITDLAALAAAKPAALKEAKLSDSEAVSLVEEAKTVVNHARMKETGIPAVSLKKYEAAGFISPELFIGVHPAGVSLASGVSITTVCNHQEMAAKFLNQPAPEKLTRQAFDAGIKTLRTKIFDEEILTTLGFAGVYSPATLVAADSKKLTAASGLSAAKIASLQKIKF